jgi:hypothetical protein
MKFKDYINEKTAMSGFNLSRLIGNLSIPVSTNMMDRLGYSYEDEAYHVTDVQYLESLIKLQGKKKQISAFTKGGNELMKLPSNPTVLIKLEGNIVIEADSDMWTLLDKQGRRWITLANKDDDVGTEYSEKLRFFIKGILNKIVKKLGYEELGDKNMFSTDISRMIKSDRAILYKEYIKEVEKYLEKDGYKLLNKHLKENITYSYNEVILNKFKIQGAYSLDNDSKKQEIEKSGIKYLGVITKQDMANIGK